MTRLVGDQGAVGPVLGRAEEFATLDAFAVRVRDGLSGALAVVGEAGIGKTALLKGLSGDFSDVRFIEVVGTESEQPLAYAGLQQLLTPFMEGVDLLPDPQRAALRSAFGMTAGSAPDRFVIGLATLSLLARAARERPLICLIDDAQWLDAESLAALGFVGRRIEADSLGLLVTVRVDADGEPAPELAGWPVLRLAGLDQAASTSLLFARHGLGISVDVVRRLFEGTGGNPLALITVAAWLSKEQRAGRAALTDPLPVGKRLEPLFSAQVRSLPAATRHLLLLAAAASPDDPVVFWKAAALLKLSADLLDPAVAAGVVALRGGAGVAFLHPLVRSAVYSDASSGQRRAAHAALAVATDHKVDPDRRSWQLAAATIGPDEEVAAALEASSKRAADRGGFVARAAFLRRSGELSVDATRRTSRFLASAQAYYLAGDPTSAQTLLDQLPDQLPDVAGAERDRLQMMLEIAGSRPGAVAAIILRSTAGAGPTQIRQTRDALFEALHACILTGRFCPPELSVRVATEVLSAVSNGLAPKTSADRLAEAFATRMLASEALPVDLLRAATADAGAEWPTNAITWFAMNFYAHTELWDVDVERHLYQGMETTLRTDGALSGLVMVILQLAGIEVRDGHFAAADVYYAEAAELLHSLNNPSPELYTTFPLAWKGQEAKLRQMAELANQIYGQMLGIGLLLGLMNYSLLILELSLGRYPEALEQANQLFAEDSPATGSLCLPAMVEAASRSGDHQRARLAFDRLSMRATAVGNVYVEGLRSRSAALISPDHEAEQHYVDAIDALGREGVATDLAWAQLLYGEWLRRQKRVAAARTQLQVAYDAFQQMGAVLWAERARGELIAAGQHLSPRASSGRIESVLTSQEARIAGLAAQGLTNQEIATQLFLGVSTVEYHLTKIFRKHHLTSRRELRQLLAKMAGPAAAAPPTRGEAPG